MARYCIHRRIYGKNFLKIWKKKWDWTYTNRTWFNDGAENPCQNRQELFFSFFYCNIKQSWSMRFQRNSLSVSSKISRHLGIFYGRRVIIPCLNHQFHNSNSQLHYISIKWYDVYPFRYKWVNPGPDSGVQSLYLYDGTSFIGATTCSLQGNFQSYNVGPALSM